MKIIVEKDYEQLCETAAMILFSEILGDGRRNISVTAGGTPLGAYQLITDKINRKQDYLKDVHFYNFDEIPTGDQDGLVNKEIENYFYSPSGISKDNIHPITKGNYKDFPNEINSTGGMDFVLLGMGEDGHFCGNMPMVTNFEKEIYTFSIEEKYPWYSTFSNLFENKENIPEYAITVGAKLILQSKKILLLVNGERKSDALETLLHGPITIEFPASILKLHPNLILLTDEAAMSEL